MLEIAAWLIFANLLAFALMIVDKAAAASGGRRIAERTLVGWSVLGGSAGALLASVVVRHKTRKQPIATILRAMPVIHAGLAITWILASPGPLP